LPLLLAPPRFDAPAAICLRAVAAYFSFFAALFSLMTPLRRRHFATPPPPPLLRYFHAFTPYFRHYTLSITPDAAVIDSYSLSCLAMIAIFMLIFRLLLLILLAS